MKFKKYIYRILKKNYENISINKKAIILIDIYLNKLVENIKLSFIETLINIRSNAHIRKKTKRNINEIFPGTYLEDNIDNNKPDKLRLFRLKQILASLLPFNVYKYSIEYANNVLMEYLRQKQKKEKLNDTPRSRSYDRFPDSSHTLYFNHSKIRKYFKESNIKMIEKSYVFLVIVFEWIVDYIFNKIIGENIDLKKIRVKNVQNILNKIDF